MLGRDCVKEEGPGIVVVFVSLARGKETLGRLDSVALLVPGCDCEVGVRCGSPSV